MDNRMLEKRCLEEKMLSMAPKEMQENLVLCIEPRKDAKYITKNYLDLQLCVKLKITDNYFARVTERLMNYVGIIDEETLFRLALKNMSGKIFMNTISALLMSMGEPVPITGYDYDIWVLGSTDMIYGASVLAMPDKIKELAGRTGKDLWLLPSSIHEIIAVTDSAKLEADELKKMVSEINQIQVPLYDRLGNSAYKYVRKTGTIEIH